jgi:hypothetical protein
MSGGQLFQPIDETVFTLSVGSADSYTDLGIFNSENKQVLNIDISSLTTAPTTLGNVVFNNNGSVSFNSSFTTAEPTGELIIGNVFKVGMNTSSGWVAGEIDSVSGSLYTLAFNGVDATANVDDVSAVPLPPAAILFLSAVTGIALIGRYLRRRASRLKNMSIYRPVLASAMT